MGTLRLPHAVLCFASLSVALPCFPLLLFAFLCFPLLSLALPCFWTAKVESYSILETLSCQISSRSMMRQEFAPLERKTGGRLKERQEFNSTLETGKRHKLELALAPTPRAPGGFYDFLPNAGYHEHGRSATTAPTHTTTSGKGTFELSP